MEIYESWVPHLGMYLNDPNSYPIVEIQREIRNAPKEEKDLEAREFLIDRFVEMYRWEFVEIANIVVPIFLDSGISEQTLLFTGDLLTDFMLGGELDKEELEDRYIELIEPIITRHKNEKKKNIKLLKKIGYEKKIPAGLLNVEMSKFYFPKSHKKSKKKSCGCAMNRRKSR